jgi:hypothetical protein
MEKRSIAWRGLVLYYGHRRIDFGGIDFEEQFTGYGFNTNLPTGENSLSINETIFFCKHRFIV